MEIAAILEKTDLSWFTVLLNGDSIARYVVAFTNNTERSVELLEAQVRFYKQSYENITLGWRTSEQGDVFIDVWTSTDSLAHARSLQKRYNQQAIRDNVTGREIY